MFQSPDGKVECYHSLVHHPNYPSSMVVITIDDKEIKNNELVAKRSIVIVSNKKEDVDLLLQSFSGEHGFYLKGYMFDPIKSSSDIIEALEHVSKECLEEQHERRWVLLLLHEGIEPEEPLSSSMCADIFASIPHNMKVVPILVGNVSISYSPLVRCCADPICVDDIEESVRDISESIIHEMKTSLCGNYNISPIPVYKYRSSEMIGGSNIPFIFRDKPIKKIYLPYGHAPASKGITTRPGTQTWGFRYNYISKDSVYGSVNFNDIPQAISDIPAEYANLYFSERTKSILNDICSLSMTMTKYKDIMQSISSWTDTITSPYKEWIVLCLLKWKDNDLSLRDIYKR